MKNQPANPSSLVRTVFSGALCLFLFLALASTSQAAAHHPWPSDGDTFLFHNLKLRPGVRVDVTVQVFGSPNRHCQLAIHGFMHSAAIWQPYADAHGGCVLALDLPGRGTSGLPRQLLYSDLLLEDHVTVLRKTLRRLHRRYGIRPSTLIAHSQGGLLVQMLQQRLQERGTSLRQRFRVRETILLAPAHPAEVPSAIMDSGAALDILQMFLVDDPDLGMTVQVPAVAFPQLFFSNLLGEVSTTAPTPTDIEAEGYNAPAEPLLASLQLSGSLGFPRPSVNTGSFNPDLGTRLRLITFSQDILFRPLEHEALYQYLTGDLTNSCIQTIDFPEAVHDLVVSDPGAVVSAIVGLANCNP